VLQAEGGELACGQVLVDGMGGLGHHFSLWIFRIQNCIQNFLGLFYGETLFFVFLLAVLAVRRGLRRSNVSNQNSCVAWVRRPTISGTPA
jgi:hypothetical protein